MSLKARWVTDINVPIKVCGYLKESGIECVSAIDHDWGLLINGELVAKAVENGYTVLLTQDRLFFDSAAKSLKKNPAFSIVLLTIPQCKSQLYVEKFKTEYSNHPIIPLAGKLLTWPISSQIE